MENYLSKFRLEDKVAIVCGAVGIIGWEISIALAQAGAKVLALAGIKDVWSRTSGQTKVKLNLIEALMDALKKLSEIKVKPEDIEKLGIIEGKMEGFEEEAVEAEVVEPVEAVEDSAVEPVEAVEPAEPVKSVESVEEPVVEE